MNSIYSIVVGVHIVVGLVALVTYWIAALARKGGTLHRGAGKVFLLAMIGIIVTALPLSGFQFARGQQIGGLFLGYLTVLVTTACWAAWFAIRYKREPARFYGRTNRMLGAACFLSGATVSILGFAVDSMLLGFFGLIGVVAGIEGFKAMRRREHPPRWWLREHYGAMIGNGVATHIAFLGIGLRGLLPDVSWGQMQFVAWFGPVAVAIVAAIWLDRRYGRAPAPVRPSVQAS